MTNTVKPSITIATTEIWFDPTGATKQPVEVRFSIDQTDAGAAPYLAGGTIRRSQENVQLYLDDKCTKPLVFSENQARISNAELVKDNGIGKPAGTTVWLLGTGSSLTVGVRTKLVLALDMLETSERKQTDFSTGSKTNRINVDNTAPAGTQELDVKAAKVVTPRLAIGQLDDPDPRVWPEAPLTPLIATIDVTANESTVGYDGDAELELDPPDAKLGLFADAAGTRAVPLVSGKAKLPNASLKVPDAFWLQVAGDVPPAGVKLTLRLLPATQPAKVRTAGSVTQGVLLARSNVVTPKLTVSLPEALDGVLWFPPLAAVATPSVALQITQTHRDEVPYPGDGRLVRSGSGLQLFWDAALTRPLAFFDDAIVIPNALLTGSDPLRLYMTASERGSVKLTLSLYDPKRRALVVGAAVEQTIACKPVNVVTPRIEYDGTVALGRLTRARVLAVQTNAADAAYEKSGRLTRSDASVALYGGQQDGRGTDPVFAGSELGASLPNVELVDAGKVWLVSWGGINPPASDATLSLALPPSARAYVVTDPAAQLAVQGVQELPPVPLAGSNAVVPKIETEYDLVLLATREADDATRTTPVRARFYVAQSNAQVPYQGDGKLVRSGSGVRVFLDAACKVELGFSDSNIAVIPNAMLVDPKRIYWLQGAAAGKVTLKLSATAPADGAPRPAITLAKEATKDLAVVALELQVYRDDGGLPVIASVPMTQRDQRTRGRFVPVQNPIKSDLGRARIVVKKVATSDWPDSADSHVVRLAVISEQDTVEVLDSETGGSVVASKTTALALGKGKAGSKDNEYWAQGKAASARLRDVRIDLGLDRSDGAGWDDPKPLRGGDFAWLTSVGITKVTPDASDWKQFVNQPPDHAVAVNDNQVEASTGRAILVTADVQPAAAGIGIDFVLWGFATNGDPDSSTPPVQRIPATLQASRVHVTAVTNDAGRASARLELSRFGGDRFFAVAFVADDAIKGLAELGKKGDAAPAATKSKPIEVWQKLSYTLAVMRRWDAGDYSARANEPTFKAKFAASFLLLERKGAVAIVPHRTVLDDASAVAGWWTGNGLPAPAERTFNLVLCDSLADPPVDNVVTITAPATTDAALGLKGTYDLGSPAAWLRSGTGQLRKILDNSLVATIDDGRFALAFVGPADYRLRVDLSGLLPSGVLPSQVKVSVTLRLQDTYSGFSYGPKTFVAMRLREQDASSTYDPTESANHTMWHESGHYLGLTAMKVPDAAGNLNVFWYQGRTGRTDYNKPDPPPPTKISADFVGQKIGQGPHCRSSAFMFHPVQLATGGLIAPGQSPQCIMYHALSTPITVDYCADCEKALRARDLSSPSVSGSADF